MRLRGLSGRVSLGLLVALAVGVLSSAQASAQGLDLFVTNQGNSNLTTGGNANVGAFTIGSSGSLSAFTNSPFTLPSGGFPYGAAVTPDDQYGFFADQVSNIDPFKLGEGSVTAQAPVSTGTGTTPEIDVVSPNGQRLYALDFGTQQISGFTIGSGGSLTPLPGSPYSEPVASPESLVMTPDGAHVYVAGFAGPPNFVAAFNVQSNGALTPASTPEYPVGAVTDGMRVTPNGQYLYATAINNSNPISIFQIHADGTLTAIAAPTDGSTEPSTAPEISPSGNQLYFANFDQTIDGYSIASNGTLTPLPGSPYSGLTTSGYTPWDFEMTPDGHLLYAVYSDQSLTNDGLIATFDVGSGGALTMRPGTTDTGGTEPFQESMTIAPDPGPTAAITASAAPSGHPTSFSAASSHATVSVYGSLTYSWSFGDGTTAINAGATPKHVYAKPGMYTATVAVADAAGCSSSLVWTGMNSFCASDPSAAAQVTVVVPGPSISGLKQTHKRWREGSKLATISRARGKKKPPVGTTFSFKLNEAASLKLVFTHAVGGRKVHRKCVAQTQKNRRAKACKRTATAGTLKLSGRAGTNKVFFDGRITRHLKLAPGTYTVTVTATAGGRRSAPRHLTFTIVK